LTDAGDDAGNAAATLFGKQEEEKEGEQKEEKSFSFRFAQRDIDGFVKITTEIIAPSSFGMIWPLSKRQLRGLLNLSISDTNKTLLVSSSGFLPMLVTSFYHCFVQAQILSALTRCARPFVYPRGTRCCLILSTLARTRQNP
jgi:hypothetical protein